MKTIEKLNRIIEKQLRFLIRDFSELNSLLINFESSNEKKMIKSIEKLLKKLKRFTGEERVEYKLAKNYHVMKTIFSEMREELSQKEHSLIDDLLNKADVYNAILEKIGSKGGEIELALIECKKNPNQKNIEKIKNLISQAIEADRSFEILIEDILKETKKIKILKSRLPARKKHEALALIIEKCEGNIHIILYDQEEYKKIIQESEDITTWKRKAMQEGKTKELEKINQQLKDYKPKRNYFYIKGDGLFAYNQPLSFIQARIADEAIIAFAELKKSFLSKTSYLDSWEIWRIASKKGYGPYFCELIFSWASMQNRAVIVDRSEVSKPLKKIWEIFDLKRKYIIKYPSSLRKYPELVELTKKEVNQRYGESPLGAIFNTKGYPLGTSKRILWPLCLKNSELYYNKESPFFEKYAKKSFEENWLQGTYTKKSDNMVSGLPASLDKAYYYDGLRKEVEFLLYKSKNIPTYNILLAGKGFFHSFSPK